MRDTNHAAIRRIAVLGIVALAACAPARVVPHTAPVPGWVYAKVVVGDVSVEDPANAPLLQAFQSGLAEGFAELELPAAVASGLSELDDSAVLLTGRITSVDRGSAAARWLVGMGAGRARVTGAFSLSNAAGDTLATFAAEQSYAGGLGIGGASFLSIEDLMRRFGKTVARQAAQSARGGSAAGKGR